MATENKAEQTKMYALDRRKNVAHVVIDETLLATQAADDQRLACKNRRAKIDSFSYGSPSGLPICPACVKELANNPTEESVLVLLERGPMRPAAPNMWNAGSDHMPREARTRTVLERLVQKGRAVKKPGGWYRLREAGREEAAKSDQPTESHSYQGMTHEWTEHLASPQATQKDLFDFGRALGLEVGPGAPVPVLRRLIRDELERLAVGRDQETTDSPRVNLTVERDHEGLYVEIKGTRYRGEDLPGEGTWVLDASTYTAINNHREAEIEWSGETPSGRCRARLREA